MCGIAGILKVHDPKDGPPPPHLESIPEAWLDILDESIKHRGPDGQGRFRDRAMRADGVVVDVAFVHRRLSIIDHEGGHQPMVHDGERLREDLTYQPGETPKLAHELCPADEQPDLVAVVFNGCIYNHRELRAELETLGHRFETDHSDTEVLVHGWRAWGKDTGHRIDAMAAHMTWSRNDGTMLALRDRYGEKPLHWTTHAEHDWSTGTPPNSGMTVWSSSASPIYKLITHGRLGTGDYQFKHWIRYGCKGPSCYGLAGAMQVWPGNWRLAPCRWTPSTILDWSGHSVETAREEGTPESLDPHRLDRLLEASVRSRLEADVPIGCFLSGGIDSGLILAFAQRADAEITAVTVRMPDPRYDESEAAAATAAELGAQHVILDCDERPSEDLVKLIQGLGLPFGDSSLLPTYWVSRATRQVVGASLSGDGGDELFAGYERHVAAPVINRWASPFLPPLPIPQSDPRSKWTKFARLYQAMRHERYGDLVSVFPTKDLKRLTRKRSGVGGVLYRCPDPREADLLHYLPNDLLCKTDTASMAVSLEVRAPFLARDLVEAAMATPLDVIMPNGERKGLLKQVARKYLPDHIVNRPKQGFAIPVGEWFRTDYGNMRSCLYDHLESADPFPGLADAGVEINMTFVRKMLREHDAAGEKSLNPWHGRDHSQRLYMLLVLSIWAKWLAGLRTRKD